MSLRTRFFALTYDRQMGKVNRAGLLELREGLLSQAHGDVLEIGAGTGTNIDLYGPAVESLTLTEPDPSMIRRLERRVGEHSVPATVLRTPAEDLPFDDDSFDTVVSALVLCGVDDQPRALREIRRVLRPGGTFLFLEHVLSDDPGLARMQHRMNPVNRFVVCCDCNRPTLASIESAGFEVARLERATMPKAPKFVRPLIVGAAVPA
jgi:ubiquinone/menaquinone biosynthesis C-methylase UbiE